MIIRKGSRLPAVILTLSLIIGLASLFFSEKSTFPILAQSESELGCDRDELEDDAYAKCLEKRKSELEKKIEESKQQSQTLSNAIGIINSQAQLQRLQIAQTQSEIYVLEKEINELGERIEGLSLSLDRLSSMLIERIGSSYKQQRTSSTLSIFTNGNFSTFVTQLRYLQQAERQTARAMEEAENQRVVYDEQKSLKEIKQERLHDKRVQLQTQQQELEKNKAEKERLLAQTKNDEATYQRLLAQAQAEISSIKAYSQALFGSSYCLDSPAPQPDGWFFSQRDSRWCGSRIGNSNDSIGAVGCLVTSTAMIWKKHGADATPLSIANNTSFFNLNTAYMILPTPAPPGFISSTHARDLNLIDSELEKGRPVIVRLSVYFTSVGTHFVVLKSGSNGNYIMNDPLYQADMSFSSKYSTNQITSVRVFKPS
jgi:peptidoglycan hydrolase CwlO-like protein